MARAIDPAQVQGRIIIIPMLNPPAGQAGTRLSPVDGKNMNRSFPGERNGTLTSMIAHYVTNLPVAFGRSRRGYSFRRALCPCRPLGEHAPTGEG